VTTSATVTARSAFQIFIGGQPPELKCLIEVLMNGLFYRVQLLLCVQEITCDGVVQQSLATLLELFNFIIAKGNGVLLLFLQGLTLAN